MKNNSRKRELILVISVITLLGAAAVLNLMRVEYPPAPPSSIHMNESAWMASYSEADFSSPEIRELVRQLQEISRGDRDPEMLRPVIIQIGVHMRKNNEAVPAVVADLLRDLAVEHPVRDIRLMAYSTMINALQKEAGEDSMAIGFAAR